MKVSIGNSRNTKKWKETDLSLNELFNKVSVPTVTNESFNTYLSLEKKQQDDLKDVGGFVGGRLRNGRRKKEDVLDRTILTLDADYLGSSADLQGIVDKLNNSHIEFIIYSTRKHTAQSPRIRILIPFKEPISPDAYEPLARKICDELGMRYFDHTTTDVNRLMFFPSVSVDMQDEFFTARNLLDAPPLDVNDYLTNNYDDWHDCTQWPLFPNETEKMRDRAKTQQDPTTKEGIIGKFCQAYDIHEAIATFLPTVYEPVTQDRYTYLKGSTAGGAIVYDDKFLYSYHSTDPASTGHLCNAFDLVRIHKFGDSKDSVKEMTAFAANDEKVKGLILDEDLEELKGIQEEQSEENEVSFRELLQKLSKDKNGKNESTIDNILLILEMDPNLKEFYKDIFRDWVVVTGKLPWSEEGAENYPRNWSDTDDSGLQWYLEKYYKLTGERKILHALNLCFQNRAVHPVRKYFESLHWDGTKRLDTLLIDYFGADDNVYTREIMKKALVAAVSRIYKPGTKFDNMPIIVGSQGIGKSTFVATLGREWFSDSLTEFSGKDAMEMLNGNLIIEIGELNGFRKAEMDAIKQFLSKQADEYRAAYARRKEVHPRQCIFFGTTNESTFLRDLTGNRRFWPVQSYPDRVTKNVWEDLPEEVDQIWAEAYVLYLLGEDLRLSPQAEKLAKIEQESRLEEDPRKDMIIDFILKKVPKDWEDRTVENKKAFFDYYPDASEDLIRRTKISAVEIHCGLFGMEENTLDQRTTRELNRILDSIPGLENPRGAIKYGSGKTNQKSIRGRYVRPEFYEIFDEEV